MKWDQLILTKDNPAASFAFNEISENDIAIIGMSAKLPQSKNVEELWDNLYKGKDLITALPPSRTGDIEAYIRLVGESGEDVVYPVAAYMEDIDKFDHVFFQMSPRQAALMDPHHRIFLETVWEAIEDAGYGGKRITGQNVGVYAGFNPRLEYKKMIAAAAPSSLADSLTPNLPSLLGSLVAYILDLQGPNMTINTACSSSLAAVHVACQALRNGECDMALVGGIRLSLLPHEDIVSADIGIVSSTGKAMVFDDRTDGSGGGEGSIAMLLKPLSSALEDNDQIHAVIKGSAVNNDGRSASLAAPNPEAQRKVISKAWQEAGVDPETVSYIEAHGTGTRLGDPIEIEGITRAFRQYTDRKQFCAVGSVKSNMGHLDTAAGIAGMLKSVLALKHRVIPASLHFEIPNQHIDFESSPVYVNRAPADWTGDGQPLRCGVTSFGLSGTNVHLVLEQAPEQPAGRSVDIRARILALSAQTGGALQRLVKEYILMLRQQEDVNLDDLCYTANTGRGHYCWRIAVVFGSYEELLEKLAKIDWTSRLLSPAEGIFYSADPPAGLPEEHLPAVSAAAQNPETLGGMYAEGREVCWEQLYEGQSRYKISLPTYPFEPTRCWIDANPARLRHAERSRAGSGEDRKAAAARKRTELQAVEVTGKSAGAPYTAEESLIARVWGTLLGYGAIHLKDNYYVLGGDSILALRIVNTINEELGTALSVTDLLRHQTVEELAQLTQNSRVSVFKPIPPAPLQDNYPLSSSQRRLYVVEQLEGPAIKYNLPHAALLKGELDRERLQRAYAALLERHEILRTSFDFRGGEPVQLIREHAAGFFDMQDAADTPLESLLEQFVRPFDLREAPLLRMTLFKRSAEEHLLVYDIHHIIFDGVSIGVMIRDLLALYHGDHLAPLAIQYKDFACWQQARLQHGELEEHRAYWITRFADQLPQTRIPADFEFRGSRRFTAGTVRFELDAQQTLALRSLSVEAGATLYMTLLSGFSLLISRYTGQSPLVLGSPVSGRTHSDLEPLIGVFINVLPMLVNINPADTFRDLLAQVQATALQAYSHQDYPFEELVEQLKLPRDTDSHPLFNMMFALHPKEEPQEASEGLRICESGEELNTAAYDLTLDVLESGDRILCSLVYADERYLPDTMQSLCANWVALLDRLAASPDQPLKDISMLTAREEQKLLEAFAADSAGGQASRPGQAGRHRDGNTATEMLMTALKTYGEQPAWICGAERLSYRELDERSDRLAKHLMAYSHESLSLVGLLLSRSSALIVAMLAVLKSGMAYLPLDPEYPAGRLEYTLHSSGVRLLLCEEEPGQGLGYTGDVLLLNTQGYAVGTAAHTTSPESAPAGGLQYMSGNITGIRQPDDLAYVIYTSGSTGNPKGVMIEQKALAHLLMHLPERLGYAPGRSIAALTTVSFDIFVLESLAPLAWGMTVVLADEQHQREAPRLLRLLREHGVDLLQVTPSRLRLLLDESGGVLPPELRTLLVGGEAFPPDLLASLRRSYNGELYNLYGPTETTVWSLVKQLDDASRPLTIGRPFGLTRAYILGSRMELLPVGCTGELWLGGPGLARGYLGQADLTGEKFVSSPFEPRERLYRTGDRARWRPDGEVEFLGRVDEQIKINGYRVELGDIECRLSGHEAVKEVAVRAWDGDDGGRLVAYVRADRTLQASELTEYLAGHLPSYMLPASYMQLAELPRTSNGKLDRRALPYPESGRLLGYGEQREAGNAEEAELLDIWKQVLQCDQISLDLPFFEQGGTSLMLVRMHRELDKRYPGAIALTELFGYTTVSRIAHQIRQSRQDLPELRLHPLRLPAEYKAKDRFTGETVAVLRYELPPAQADRLAEAAKRWEIPQPLLLLGLYALLLEQLGVKVPLSLTAVIAPEPQPALLQFPATGARMQQAEDLRRRMLQVQKTLERAEHCQPEELLLQERALPRAVRGQGPLALFRSGASPRSPLFEQMYDLLLDCAFGKQEGKGLILTLTYNARVLDAVGTKRLFSAYIRLLQSAALLITGDITNEKKGEARHV